MKFFLFACALLSGCTSYLGDRAEAEHALKAMADRCANSPYVIERRDAGMHHEITITCRTGDQR